MSRPSVAAQDLEVEFFLEAGVQRHPQRRVHVRETSRHQHGGTWCSPGYAQALGGRNRRWNRFPARLTSRCAAHQHPGESPKPGKQRHLAATVGRSIPRNAPAPVAKHRLHDLRLAGTDVRRRRGHACGPLSRHAAYRDRDLILRQCVSLLKLQLGTDAVPFLRHGQDDRPGVRPPGQLQ